MAGVAASDLTVVVSAKQPCADTNPGTKAQPLCTNQAGVTTCRTKGHGCSVILSDGTHRLSSTVTILPADSGLTIVADAGGVDEKGHLPD